MKIVFDCYLRSAHGYGYAAIQLALALSAFPDVELLIPNSSKHVLTNTPIELRQKIVDPESHELHHGVTIAFRTPPPETNTPLHTHLIWYTMWESTRVPSQWKFFLNNHVAIVIVPSNSQIEIMRNSGINTDIAVVPLGVNNQDYYPLKRSEKEEYIFGLYGSYLDHRKGVDILYKAFTKEFPAQDYPSIQLWYKGDPPFNWPITDDLTISDSRVRFFSRSADSSSNVAFLSNIDCFVFPTRGEGFGLPPLEAMATGLPVIATNWSGPEDYMDEEYAYPLSYSLTPVDLLSRNPNYRYTGYWAEPKIEHLQALMRQCYENRRFAEKKGERAAQIVSKRWSWTESARLLIKQVEQLSRSGP